MSFISLLSLISKRSFLNSKINSTTLIQRGMSRGRNLNSNDHIFLYRKQQPAAVQSLFFRGHQCYKNKLSSSSGWFSSSTTTTTNRTDNNNSCNSQKHLERVIYRQLLRWCNRTDSSVPLSCFIEAEGITVHAKPYNEDNLRQLLLSSSSTTTSDEHEDNNNNNKNKVAIIQNLLPPHEVRNDDNTNGQSSSSSSIKELWVPLIKNSNELRNFLRALYRLNDDHTNDKERTSQAFQLLRSLNELNQEIKELKQQHERNSINRDEHVHYHVGQVVQHKEERWRGIIVGWEKGPPATSTAEQVPSQYTSLTTKTYQNIDDDSTTPKKRMTIKYQVILDAGDMNRFTPHTGNSTTRSSMYQGHQNMFMMEDATTALQTDLVPVTNASLCRIRSSDTEEYFSNYDTHSNSFIMNELLSYRYPKDQQQAQQKQCDNSKKKDNKIAKGVIVGIQQFSNYLLKQCHKALEETSTATNNTKNILLASISERLSMMSTGDIIDPKVLLQHRADYYRDFIFRPDQKQPEEKEEEIIIKRKGMVMKIPSISLATMYLRQLLSLTHEVRDILWHYQNSKRNLAKHNVTYDNDDGTIKKKKKKYLQFRLGDIVQHKEFGFRGVVVAWDPKPVVNVLKWDGVQKLMTSNKDINPMEIPFYHVIPDQRDCIDTFGAERPIRYVCEENLQWCPKELVDDIRINFEDVLSSSKSKNEKNNIKEINNNSSNNTNINDDNNNINWTFDSINGKYIAPLELKFRHGEEIGDSGATEAYLTKLQNELTWFSISQRSGGGGGDDDNMNDTSDSLKNNDNIDTIAITAANQLSLKNLFELLKVVDTALDATAIEETITEIWKAHSNNDIRFQLDSGINSLLRWKYREALSEFKQLVHQGRKGDDSKTTVIGDDQYAEAWNKIATCEFMIARELNNDEQHLSNSIKACKRAINILPNHFQALNGMGLVYYEQQKFNLAAEAFGRSLKTDPWSPVSSKFSACIDLIENQKKKQNKSLKDTCNDNNNNKQ